MSALQSNHGTDQPSAQARKGIRHPLDVTLSDELALALAEKRIFELTTDCGRTIILVGIDVTDNLKRGDT